MREIYKNPMLYYVLAPVLVLVWPLLVWGFYVPRAQSDCDRDKGLYEKAKAHAWEIFQKDPDRVDHSKITRSLGKFTYAEAVDRVANICRIAPGNVDLQTGKIRDSRGKEMQQAHVSLNNVGIVQAAKFLSTIQAMWVNLTCERVKLSAKEGMPDKWDVDFDFDYDY